MACCGSRRALLTTAASRAWRSPPAPAPKPTVVSPRLRYGGPVPMVLAGAISKRIYEFYEAHVVVDIDVRDEPTLRATGWFESAE